MATSSRPMTVSNACIRKMVLATGGRARARVRPRRSGQVEDENLGGSLAGESDRGWPRDRRAVSFREAVSVQIDRSPGHVYPRVPAGGERELAAVAVLRAREP